MVHDRIQIFRISNGSQLGQKELRVDLHFAQKMVLVGDEKPKRNDDEK